MSPRGSVWLLRLGPRLRRRRNDIFHAHISDYIPVDLVVMCKIQDQKSHARIASLPAAFLGDVDHIRSGRIGQRRVNAVPISEGVIVSLEEVSLGVQLFETIASVCILF